MFNMREQSKTGYKLVIIYNHKLDRYNITGYTAFEKDGRIQYSQDGESMQYSTMEDAMKSITEYPDK